MPVDEEIDLSKPLSSDDVDKLNREADEIEEAAKRAEEATDNLESHGDKAEEEVKKLARNLEEAEEKEKAIQDKLMNSDKIRRIAEKHGLAVGKGPTGGIGGGESVEAEDESPAFVGPDTTGSGAVLPADRPRDKSSKSPVQQLSQFQKLLQQSMEKHGEHVKKIKHIETQREHLMRRMHEVELAQERALRTFQKGIGIARNPIGFFQGQMMGLIGKVIPVALIITIAMQVFEMIKTMFGPGGVYDVRKLVKDEVTIFMDIEVYNKINRGEIFFGAAGDHLTQGQGPAWSNTEDMFTMQQRDMANDFRGRE